MGTDGGGWVLFEAVAPDPAAALIDRLPDDDGDSLVVIEPSPEPGRDIAHQSRWSASITRQDGPHGRFLVYLSFPRGPLLHERVTIPDDFHIESETQDDAILIASEQPSSIAVARCAITCLSAAIGDAGFRFWRTTLSGTGG